MGFKNYSGNNHLGNDLAIFTDRKIANNTSTNVDFYSANIVSSRDYGPFGEYLTNRVFTPDAFPNSFNGKRDDEEVNGWQNYGFRNYLKYTRRLMDRVDPITAKYPMLSPYQFASNRPIDGIDFDGLEHRPTPPTASCPALTNRMNLFSQGWEEGQGQGLKNMFTAQFWISMMGGGNQSLPSLSEIKGQINADPYGAGYVGGQMESQFWGIAAMGAGVDAIMEIPFVSPKVSAIAGEAVEAAEGAENACGYAPKEVHKGATDYSGVKDPTNLNASTKPTPRQVKEMKAANRAHNDGVLRDDVTGEIMVDSKKSTSGTTPPTNEAQVDHIKSVKNNGTRTNSNLQLRTRQNNREKWHH